MSKVPRLLTATLLGSLLGCIIICCIMMSTLVVADATSNNKNKNNDKEFRCFRPFSSLNSFSPSSMHATENCMFGPLLVKDAKAVATCASDGCKVKVELVDGQRLRVATQDRMRYSLEIKAVNDSAINYKGFDNRGYSMCCMFLDESACEWREVEQQSPATIEEKQNEAAPAETYEDPDPLGLGIKQKKARSKKAEETETKKDTPTPKQQVVVKCPLQDRADGEPVAASMSGSITKPLHVYKAGKWEVNLMLWYGGAATNDDPLTNDDMVGRLKLPFELTEEQVAKVGGSWNQEEDIEKADSSSTTAATTTTTRANLPPLDGTDDTAAPEDSGLGLVTVKKRSKDDEGEPEKKVGGAEL